MEVTFSLLFAIICAVLASSRGRNPVGWFLLGLFFSVIALVVLAVIPDLKEEERKEQHRGRRSDRLEEQVRQERQRREALADHTLARLDAHDRHAGIDTRAAAPPPLPAEAVVSQIEAEIWFYEEAGESRGPVTEAELKDRLRDGRLRRGALVWCEGMADWTPARSIPSLS